MSLHRSLKTKPAGLNQHRNVLTRGERIEKLADDNQFNFEEDSPIGLVKVASRKIKIARKQKEVTDEEGGEESTEVSEE